MLLVSNVQILAPQPDYISINQHDITEGALGIRCTQSQCVLVSRPHTPKACKHGSHLIMLLEEERVYVAEERRQHREI